MLLLNIFVFFCVHLAVSNAAKILSVFPLATRSHFSLGFAIMKELAERGHEITFISAFPQETPIKNIKDISVEGFLEEMKVLRRNLYDLDHQSIFATLNYYQIRSSSLTEYVFKNTEVQNLIKSNTTFDVVILQQFLNEAFMVFSHHFKAPAILFCSMGSSFWVYPYFSNPAPIAFVPNLFSRFSDKMSFFERLENFYIDTVIKLYGEFVRIPDQNRIAKKYFPNAPDVKDLIYDASLTLMNSHMTTTSPRPHFPNLIEIGGFHIKKPQKLTGALGNLIDNSKNGAILFCMGSNLRVSAMPKEKVDAILKSLGKIQQTVLLKWEGDEIPKLPPNVFAQKWLPQQDILAHPNVRAFISHGGLLSTIEAIYHGVPIIGIPIFGDQKTNIATAVSNGYAVSVPFQELNEEKLSWALDEILNNTKYKEMARRRSSIMHDQPLKPMDSAVYWIEYVIRHKGATHFRSAALDLYWFQRNLLDIILFLTLVTIILFYIFYKIIKKILPHRSSKIDKEKKTK